MKHAIPTIWLCSVFFPAGVALVACGDTAQPEADCDADTLLVEGTIVRQTGSGTTFDGPVEFGLDSAATITLRSHVALGGDGPSEVVATQTIRPAADLPLSFCVAGDPATITGSLDYTVSVVMEQDEGNSTVGDLISEFVNQVTPPVSSVTIEVSGLESCDDPNSGGFCL